MLREDVSNMLHVLLRLNKDLSRRMYSVKMRLGVFDGLTCSGEVYWMLRIKRDEILCERRKIAITCSDVATRIYNMSSRSLGRANR